MYYFPSSTCKYAMCTTTPHTHTVRMSAHACMLAIQVQFAVPENEQKNVGGLLTVRTTSGRLQNNLALLMACPNRRTTPNREF